MEGGAWFCREDGGALLSQRGLEQSQKHMVEMVVNGLNRCYDGHLMNTEKTMQTRDIRLE